jgi:hypothetical protein
MTSELCTGTFETLSAGAIQTVAKRQVAAGNEGAVRKVRFRLCERRGTVQETIRNALDNKPDGFGLRSREDGETYF